MSHSLERFSTHSPSIELTGEQIIANIRALQPGLQARGTEIEELRRIPDEVIAMVRQSGAFRMMMPRKWGGPEMDPLQINAALEELAIGNAAVAWVVMIQNDSGLYGGLLDQTTARQVYADLDATTSNVIRAAGRARRVEGGYLVTGRWPFASGCLHADWFAGGCLVFQDDDTPIPGANGQPLNHMMLTRREALQIHDTWYTTGLRGTGSNDVEVRNLFVPEEQVFTFENASHDSALYRWPALLCAKMPAVVLGVTRAALDNVTAILQDRRVKSEHVALALADARTLYASARSYVNDSLRVVWQRLEAGEQPDAQERVDVFLARANAFKSARAAVQLLFDAVGGPAIYARKSPLERHLRDLNTACQHIMAQRGGQLAAGQLLMGAYEDTYPFL